MSRRPPLLVLLAVAPLGACASLGLGSAVEAPSISGVEGRSPELRLAGPSADRPAGGADLRLWSRIENPNAFSLTVSRLAGDLFVGEAGGIAVEFPLGVPLVALGDTVVPLDVSLDFEDLPALAETVFGAVTSGRLPYRLEGTIGVDAGMLGRPTFGPMTLLEGVLRIRP